MAYLVGPQSSRDIHGGTKARSDIYEICSRLGIRSVPTGGNGAVGKAKNLISALSHALFGKVDYYIFNFPTINPVAALAMRTFAIRHRVVLIVHDIDQERAVEPTQGLSILNLASACLYSGSLSKIPMVRDVSSPRVHIRCWDYITDRVPQPWSTGPGVMFAGNLNEDKSPWLYDSSRKTPLFIAGRNYNAERGTKTDTFLGHFDPNIPNFPENIRWGLVWDGDSPHTLSGPTGLYQRYNQPHKFSLYLAAGIPVICHKDAAVAALVKQWKVGLCVNSIDEIPDAIKSLDSVDEAAIRDGVAEISQKIRAGYFLSEALADFIKADVATPVVGKKIAQAAAH
jgi:hypothetical protein